MSVGFLRGLSTDDSLSQETETLTTGLVSRNSLDRLLRILQLIFILPLIESAGKAKHGL
jgi:hypothetical protein